MEIHVALSLPMLLSLVSAKGIAVGHLEGVLPLRKATLAAQRANLKGQKGRRTAVVHTHLLAIAQSSAMTAKGPASEAVVALLQAS